MKVVVVKREKSVDSKPAKPRIPDWILGKPTQDEEEEERAPKRPNTADAYWRLLLLRG